jgi:hypothetical protein
VKGLHGILEALCVPSAETVVYDCTMQYTPPLTSMAKLLAGELPRECHIHLKRFTKPMVSFHFRLNLSPIYVSDWVTFLS